MIKLKNNQQGMAAIITTLVIMLLVTLIVSSFALIVRREQKQSLDRQLSTQALYAAEAGVKDAIDAINRNQITSDITDCNTFTSKSTPSFDTTNISYSCVLVEYTDHTQYDNIDATSGSVLFPVQTDAGSPLNSIDITWQNADGTTNFNATPNNLPQDAPLPTALVRATLIPADTLSRSSFNSAKTFYLYPSTSGSGSVNFAQESGTFATANCNNANIADNSNACKVSIGNLPGDNKYFLHLKPLYQKTNFKINGDVTGTGKVRLTGAQAVIDVTGRAADVLRRIRVVHPIADAEITRRLSSFLPEGALETTEEICKLWEYRGSETPINGCTGSSVNFSASTTGGGGSGGSGANGNASIGGCEGSNPPPECGSSGSGLGSGVDPNAPDFQWVPAFRNNSNNPAGSVLNCTWDWGDGTSTNYTASDPACTYGQWVNHDYNPPVDSKGWEALITSTNGNQGCWYFNVTLTMRFTPQSGLGSDTDTFRREVPTGKANDPPNPVTGQGICAGKYVNYIP